MNKMKITQSSLTILIVHLTQGRGQQGYEVENGLPCCNTRVKRVIEVANCDWTLEIT